MGNQDKEWTKAKQGCVISKSHIGSSLQQCTGDCIGRTSDLSHWGGDKGAREFRLLGHQ